MAVRYKYEVVDSNGVTEQRDMRMLIPESPEEELRGETYDEEMIKWLHQSEQQNAMKYAVMDGLQVTNIWTEKVSV